jgi:dihydrodipicolinate synthase/N-acetylneuraminate lyase
MSTYLFFCPEVAHRYWAAVEAKDMKTAWDIASRYDQAYYQFVGSLPGGFDAGIHASLEIYGICKRWRRPPYYSLNDEEMERLRDFFRGLSIL